MGTRTAPVSPPARRGGHGGQGSRTRLLDALRESRAAQIVLALTLAAAVLRFATLDVQSVWLDESATLLLVHRGFSGMLSHLATSESTPPLYYVLVWAWTKVFGAGVVGFRSFSALVGTLTVPVLYLAGRGVSQRVGIWTAALAALNPAMYYYSQEARAYGLLIFFCAIAFVCWQQALADPSGRRLGLWAVASVLALLTHYFAVFLFLPEALFLARGVGWRRMLAPVGAVALAGVALLPLAAKQRSGGQANWIEAASLSSRVAESLKQFLIGLYGPLEVISAVTAGVLVLGALALLLARGADGERQVAKRAFIVALAGVAIPLVLAAGHALDVFDGRNIIAAWIPFAVLIAAGVGGAGAGRAGALIGVALCAVSLAVIVSTNLLPGYQRDDWRGIADALSPQRAGRVIVGQEFASAPLSIYLPGLRRASSGSVSTREVAFVGLRVRHTGGSPAPGFVPTSPPPGFALVGVRRTESFSVSRFRAPRPTTLTISVLQRMSGQYKPELILQR